jgi:hypothetical protein
VKNFRKGFYYLLYFTLYLKFGCVTQKGVKYDTTNNEVVERMAEVYSRYLSHYRPTSPLQKGIFKRGKEHKFFVTLYTEMCYVIVAIGGKKVEDIELTIYHKEEKIISNMGKNATWVKLCPTQIKKFTVSLNIRRGEGKYGIQVFGRAK